VGASALDGAGLESTFHGVLPGSSTTGRNGPRFKRPAILVNASPQVNFQPAFTLFIRCHLSGQALCPGHRLAG
jgi:hypothetical protein